MTKEQISKRATSIADHNLYRCISSDRDYGITCALDMAKWLLEQIEEEFKVQIVSAHNVYSHQTFKEHKFFCLEEQKRDLLMSLKKYIETEEEITDFGTIVKMEIKVLK